MDLEDSGNNVTRRHPLANCESCPLNDPANGFVPSHFPPSGKASLAVVGEAPGFQETAYKKPFTGPSGQLIKKVLARQGWKKEEVMFSNVCLCRPPDNATPPATAIAACRGRLLHEIHESGATAIAALGNTAAKVLVDDPRTITSLRVGPAKPPTRSLDGSSVERIVPTWHPAYCLRNADAFPALVSDIAKLREERREPWTEPHWIAIDDPADALHAIEELHTRTDTLFVDIEVGVDKDESFFHPNEFDLLCVGLAYARRRVVVLGQLVLRDKQVRHALRELLQSKKLGAHNGKFDLAGLQPTLGLLELSYDTMLGSYALDERPGQHGLEVCVVEKLGYPSWKNEIKQFIPKGDKNYANIPRNILYKYNAYDVANAWDLWEYERPRLEKSGLMRVHDFMVRAANQLMFLEINGISIDLPYNFQLGNIMQERIEIVEGEINEIVRAASGYDVTFQDPNISPPKLNPRSPKQITAFLEDQGLRFKSTNKETLEQLQGLVSRTSYAGMFIEALLRHRRVQKLYSTYVIGIRKRVYRGRVYTTYMLHGTTSGRLASRNPNLQNIVRDKDIRRQFVASKPENVLIQADYKQAELRVMTTLGQDEYFRGILSNPDGDLFTELVCQLYGISREQALDGSADSKEKRIRIKAFVYGLGYGREVGSIAAEFKIPRHEAQHLRDDFFSLIPGIARWQKEVIATVHKRQQLVTPFGRRRRFYLITDQNKKDVENEALSFLPQSTASDICLDAFTTVRPLLKGIAYARLTIHDALTVECHESRQDEVAAILQREMQAAGARYTDYVPFWTDIHIGRSWGDLG